MFSSEYISCPARGFQHTLEVTTKEYNKVNGSPQWDVLYPTTRYSLQELVDDLDKAHDDFLRDSRAAFETAYDDMLDDEEDEEDNENFPACGDCGGCCECLGDPPDCRWDTTAEMDDFYREIY